MKGQSLGRAYDDYTYCPPSKALKQSQTQARVNGLLNASLAAGHVVEGWWLVAARPGEVEGVPHQRGIPPEHPLALAMRVFEHGRSDRLARLRRSDARESVVFEAGSEKKFMCTLLA